MSVTIWYMQVVNSSGTFAASLASLGIENPQTSFRSQDDDEFTFEVKQDITQPPKFNYGGRITLLKVSGGVTTTWFIGNVSKRTIIGSAGTESIRYVVSGPWFQLRRTTWEVSCQCYNPSTCLPVAIPISKIVLFQDPATGASITTGTQIANAINYAILVGIGIAPGVTPPNVFVPIEETRDLTIADVIRRSMQWTPDGVTWFNYSGGSPVFNAAQRALLTTYSIDLAQTNLVKSFTLSPRNDLAPSGVRFNYIGFAFCNVNVPNGCVDPSTGILNTGAAKLSEGKVQVTAVIQDQSGLPDQPGGIIGSIDLTQLTTLTYENAPIGLAGQYFLSLLTPTWDGNVTTHEMECSGNLRPGKVVNFVNGNPDWSTMNAQIQEVHESLYDGTTTATFGTPGHLRPQNFATLMRITQHRPLVTTGLAAVNTPGTANGTGCQQGIDPKTQKLLNTVGGSGSSVASALGGGNVGGTLNQCTLNVCVGGVSKPLKVYCPPE